MINLADHLMGKGKRFSPGLIKYFFVSISYRTERVMDSLLKYRQGQRVGTNRKNGSEDFFQFSGPIW